MPVSSQLSVLRKYNANLMKSVRWHDQLLHLDMHDHQLSPKTKSAYPPFSAEDVRR